MNFDESVHYMSGLLQFGMRLDRERFVTLLERLGDPQQRFRALHIAGTNGKGSTTTFIAAILRAAGYRVGTYLSPYVFDMRERIQIGGEMIPKEDFARWVSVLRPHIEAIAATELGQTTEFELKTAAAFCYFAEQNVDFAAIEVGIGGRLDATNVIPPPLCAVITSIGWDHMHLLGDTLAKIAAEKAGIFKPGSVGVTAVAPGEAQEEIAQIAAAQGVPLHFVAPADRPDAARALVTYRRESDGTVTFLLPSGAIAGARPSLHGAYQAGNAATAAAAIEILRTQYKVAISDDAIRAGCESAFIPGRFQIARRGANGKPTLLLDGAHKQRRRGDSCRVAAGRIWPDAKICRGHRSQAGPCAGTVSGGSRPADQACGRYAPVLPPGGRRGSDAGGGASASSGDDPRTSGGRDTPDLGNGGIGEVVVVTGSLYLVGDTPPHLR